jgi:hypothetical protein
VVTKVTGPQATKKFALVPANEPFYQPFSAQTLPSQPTIPTGQTFPSQPTFPTGQTFLPPTPGQASSFLAPGKTSNFSAPGQTSNLPAMPYQGYSWPPNQN